jgi:phosphocarrier protein
MTTRDVTVVNQLGLHARAAAKFVHLANRFQSRIQVVRAARQVDGKSIMGLLLLAAACGTTVVITADGLDESAAVEALAALIQSGFGEERAAAAPAAPERPSDADDGPRRTEK